MKTIPYRCDNAKHRALVAATQSAETSIQRVLDDAATAFINERAAAARFAVRAARGNPARGARLLAELAQRGGEAD